MRRSSSGAVDTKYYDLLGVASTATEAELRTAYKKNALRLHPDKGGDPEQFQAMKDAYDVLNDPQKRKMYDSYGPEGIKLMEGDLRPEHMMVMLSRSGKCIVVGLLAAVMSAILLPVIFFSLRWDDDVSWPWFCSFIPTWILHAAMLAFVLAVVRAPRPEGEESTWDDGVRAEYDARKVMARNVLCGSVLFHSLLITFELFLALRAEGTVDWSWVVVVVPYILIECFILCLTVKKSPANWAETKRESQRNKMVVPPPGFQWFLLRSIEWGLLRMLTSFLLAARADESFKGSWFVCFLPVFAGSAQEVFEAYLVKRKFRAELRKQAAQTNQACQEDVEEPGGGVTMAFLSVGFLLIMACGAAAKLGGMKYSAFLVFLPIIMFVVCCGFCLPACVVMQQNPEQDEAAAAQAAAAAGGAAGPGPNVFGATEAEQAVVEAALIQAMLEAAAQAERNAIAESQRTAAAEAAQRGTQNEGTEVGGISRIEQLRLNQGTAGDGAKWPARTA